MVQNQSLVLKDNDHRKISALLATGPAEVRELLQNELDRATVVKEEEFPGKIVAMNTTVVYLDLNTGKTNMVTLVYPHEANAEEGRVSILAPVGAALIGLRVGQTIRWPLPYGKEKEIQVVDVMEAGDGS